MKIIPGLSLIAALGKDGGIGKDGQLLWRIPTDLQRFKKLTMGKVIFMGRKTHESIGRPLPGRTNLVLTRHIEYQAQPGVILAHYFDPAINQAIRLEEMQQEKGIFVIGGAEVYAQALPLAERLYLTLIDDEKPADTFFPTYEHLFFKTVSEERQELDGLKYRFVELER